MFKPTLNDLSAFQDVANHSSFRKAADARGISPSTLSHTLRSLERNLGVRLLHRTTRSVSLTEAGAAFLARIEPNLEGLATAVDALGDFRKTPVGTVRINAPEAGARLLISDVMPVFRKKFPDVSVDISTEGRLVDIVAEGFDAGVRLGEAVPQDMIAVRFGTQIRFIAVASPGYLATSGCPKTPDDLNRHACIRQRLPSGKPYHWEFAKHGQEIAIDVPGKLTLDHSRLMALAAVDGLGVAFVPDTLVMGELAKGTLVEILSDWCPPIAGLHLYYSGRRQVPTALRVFIDTLVSIYK